MRGQYRWRYAVIVLALLYMAADGLTSLHSSSKTYLREAGLWLNDKLPANASLYTNNLKIYYYSGQWMNGSNFTSKGEKIDAQKLTALKDQAFDYLALQIPRDSALLGKTSALLGRQTLMTFASEKQDLVVIYQMSNR